MLGDTTGNGFGGYYLGFPDEGLPKILQKGKSTENNADIFAAFNALAGIERSLLGNTAQAEQWAQRANIAGDFAMQMVDPAGKFYAGTVPAGTTAGPGISPDGTRRGDDVINTSDLLDSNSFTILALAGSPRYRDRIDWRRPTQFMLDRFGQSITAGGRTFRGFNISPQPVAGPNGIAWEFTAQAIAAMRFVDTLYGESRFESIADAYAGIRSFSRRLQRLLGMGAALPQAHSSTVSKCPCESSA